MQHSPRINEFTVRASANVWQQWLEFWNSDATAKTLVSFFNNPCRD